MPSNIELILKENDYLSGQNASWRSYWEDVADFCLPRHAWINSIKPKGDRLKFNFLYDSEAIRDAQVCASGFHSNLNNPTTQWFDMETENLDLMDDYSVRLWISKTLRKMYGALNGSNFDTEMQEFHLSNVVFGTANILVLKDYKHKVRFMSVPIEQYNIAEDANGRVCKVFRNFRFTALQAYARWGKDAGKSVLKAVSDGKYYDEFEFLHCVQPREIRDYSKDDNANMEFESVWISKKDSHKCEESGFKEIPYIVGRFWKDANDSFGYSPAMNVLADVKTLNTQKKTVLRRGMKEADPPMQMPYRAFVAPLNFNPSALNYRKSGVEPDAIQAIGVGTGQFSITVEVMQQTIQSIRDGFYVDLFNALGDITKQMTVPEVQKRIADSMALLGPVTGRFTSEVLQPLLSRVFNILWESGEVDAPPSSLSGQNLKFTFLGPLVKAQRLSEMQPMGMLLQTVGGMAQFMPDVIDKIDTDQVVEITSRILSTDPRLIRDKDEVEKIRQNRAQMQAQDRQLAQSHVGAQAAESMAGAAKKAKAAEEA